MELILANRSGAEERVLNCEYDIEIGGTNTFELRIPYGDWIGDLSFGKRIYIPGTEYGGIISAVEGDTANEEVRVKGYTWRGYLYKRVCNGTLSGDLNSVISSLLGPYKGVFIASGKSAGKYVSTTVDHVTVGDALDGIVQAAGYKLKLTYIQTQTGGYVMIEAVPASTYTDEITQDSLLDFTTEESRMGTNHMICVNGNQIKHWYADANGNVSAEQSMFGIDEITEYFLSESNNWQEDGKKHLQERTNGKTMKVGFADANELDLDIGDFITGHDYITGIVVKKPIVIKIVKMKDSNISIEYDVEDE